MQSIGRRPPEPNGFVSQYQPIRANGAKVCQTCQLISGKTGDTKMGGRGSGRHGGLGLLVDKCHELHSIDLAWLRRKKLLNPGRWSSITWSRAGRETGSIRIECHGHGVRLVYRHRRPGSEWHDVSEFVPFVETTTNFGGRRQWFQCLSCRRNCRILYGRAYFRCRRCQGLRQRSDRKSVV